jgi:hypothetical protein
VARWGDPKVKCRNYILNAQGEPELCQDLMTWARWYEENTKARVVKQEWVANIRVSTVFLGIDHRWDPKGAPILWETMCFSNNKRADNFGGRCAGGREQAEAMHWEVVEEVKKALLHK